MRRLKRLPVNVNRATKPTGLLQPLASSMVLADMAWQRVHVDFATHQAKHYLIMVDAHSKWPEVIGRM